MSKLIIYILIFSFYFFKLSAQSIVFNETYDYGFSHYEGADYIVQNKNTNDYFMLSQHLNPFIIDSVTGISIFRIDEFGNILDKNLVKFFDEACIGGGLLVDKSSIYAVGVFRDINENNNFDSYFIKFNENLDTILTKIIDIGYNNNARRLIKVDENKFRFISYYYPDSTISQNSQVVMVSIDTLGNILDQWEYGGPSYDFAYDYKPTDDGGYIIGGMTRDSLMDDADLFLLKIDSNGTEEWYNKYGTTNEESVRTWNYIETTADGGYLIAAEENHNPSVPPFLSTKGLVLKVDSNGLLLWEKKIYINQARTINKSIRVDYDENIILAGGMADYDTSYIPFNAPRGYLHKYSSDGETLIWERFFSKFWQQDDYVHDMILTSDGGILVSGYILSAPNTANDAWLVKFDSCGYTVGDIPEPMLIIDSVIDKTVYITDQSTNYCTAALDWGDGSELQNYYAYENNQPLAEKHFSHTYSQIDDYTIKTTALAGEEFRDYEVQVLGLSNHSIGTVIPAQAGISLFPNPANDFVIIQNPYSSFVIPASSTVIPATSTVIPAQAGISMSVYTLSGKQVKSINLNPKLYQQKLDVSSLNNGVYFVRFEMAGEFVGTEKLVIAR